ncbi:hypothetical protein CLU79DRAFT_517324 [Phycomyces nitens]|nr:hypothetical protein CLU79DRAFT_517324 [Phycomyces nitens]
MKTTAILFHILALFVLNCCAQSSIGISKAKQTHKTNVLKSSMASQIFSTFSTAQPSKTISTTPTSYIQIASYQPTAINPTDYPVLPSSTNMAQSVGTSARTSIDLYLGQ